MQYPCHVILDRGGGKSDELGNARVLNRDTGGGQSSRNGKGRLWGVGGGKMTAPRRAHREKPSVTERVIAGALDEAHRVCRKGTKTRGQALAWGRGDVVGVGVGGREGYHGAAAWAL